MKPFDPCAYKQDHQSNKNAIILLPPQLSEKHIGNQNSAIRIDCRVPTGALVKCQIPVEHINNYIIMIITKFIITVVFATRNVCLLCSLDFVIRGTLQLLTQFYRI